MAAIQQAELLFRSVGALLLGWCGTVAAPGGAPAQEHGPQDQPARARIGAPLPDLDSCEEVRAERAGLPQPSAHLMVLLPSGRAALLAAESNLVRWAEELDDESVRIDTMLPAEAAAYADVKPRGPKGQHARFLDRRGAVSEWFEAATGERVGARYALADAQRRVLRVGRLDDGVRHELADAAAGRFDLGMALRIAGRASDGERVAATAGGDREATRHWSEVVGRIEHLAWPQGEKQLGRILEDVLLRYAERPVWVAHVAEAVLVKSPALAADERVRKVLAQGLRRVPFDPTLRRVSFRIHAGISDDRRARAHGMAWLESCKGVPGRCGEVLDVLEAMDRGTERFEDLADRVFELGLDADPGDGWLAKKAFEHHAARRNHGSAAKDYGLRYVASMQGDAQALNSFAWKLLTREGYAGEHAELALAAARAMESDPSWRTYWRVDTLALACFENGRFAEAVELQREAVEAADGSAVVRYSERLQRYRQALADAGR